MFSPAGTRKGAWSPLYSVRSSVPVGTEQFVYNQWIQADFAKPTLIRSITTKGSSSATEYVTEYSIQYSYNDAKNWQYYQEESSRSTKVSLSGLRYTCYYH